MYSDLLHENELHFNDVINVGGQDKEDELSHGDMNAINGDDVLREDDSPRNDLLSGDVLLDKDLPREDLLPNEDLRWTMCKMLRML